MPSEPVRPGMPFWSLLCVVSGLVGFFLGIGQLTYQFFVLDEGPYSYNIVMTFNCLLFAGMVLHNHRNTPA